MRSDSYDIAIIGAGSAGMAAARRAAEHGQKVVLYEGRHAGGTCVNAGCVPKKLLVHASRTAEALAAAGAQGWSTGPASFDWPTLRDRVLAEVQRLSAAHRARLAEAGVTLVPEAASLDRPGRVLAADGSTTRAAAILIATGARPRLPPIEGLELCLTSDDIFHLSALPKRLAIVGGGYIAVEFACMMVRFGVEVTLFEAGDRLIGAFDAEPATRLAEAMEADGIDLRFGARVSRTAQIERGVALGSGAEVGPFDEVLIATGRAPNTQGLGLAEAGVGLTEDGAIAIDGSGRTTAEGIWAAGDVAERMMLTPVAIRGGRRAVDAILGRPERGAMPAIPTATFTTPECAGIGLTEAGAQAAGQQVSVRRKRFRPLTAVLSADPAGQEILLKAVVHAGSGTILGLHFFGPQAAEAAQLGAAALSAGLTVAELGRAMPLHPSIAEEVIGLGDPDAPLHGGAPAPTDLAAE